ncbi:GDSL-type esterase/lipase family protein [Pectinatus haikarae]|uniref:SGNH/GDSL hydrolase family protein n=1 Tax=Pectinatus haikarae TaxID=349096 RepID=UPI003D807548
MFKAIFAFCVFVLLASQFSYTCAALPAQNVADGITVKEQPLKISILWSPVPNAVQYELNISNALTGQQITAVQSIYATGYELDTGLLPETPDQLQWQVRGLDYNGNPISDYSPYKALGNSIINSDRPIPTTQFDKMAYTPLYPVYSWIPYLHAAKYTLRIYYDDGSNVPTHDKLLNEYQTDDTFDFYDPAAYTQAGKYYWTVQARDADNKPISRWSAPSYFSVTDKNIKVAALGDSITHGGGAISTPPGYTMYNWQTYSVVPILNIGYSGDTTGAMLHRFSKDVLPFHPRILVIMGGINDIRAGISADEAIQNLSAIRSLCLDNNIIPVMVTASPIYPEKMQRIDITPAPDWQRQLSLLNHWILSYPDSIDTYLLLADNQGLLKSSFTTDGLHPDAAGKKIIGETISTALLKKYPVILSRL